MRIEIQETTEQMIIEQMDGTSEENAVVDVFATAMALDEANVAAVTKAFPSADVELASNLKLMFRLDARHGEMDDAEFAQAERDIQQLLEDAWDSQAFWRFNA
jgi:hypothetical protein